MLQVSTLHCCTRIGFQTVCDVTNQACTPASQKSDINEQGENVHLQPGLYTLNHSTQGPKPNPKPQPQAQTWNSTGTITD